MKYAIISDIHEDTVNLRLALNKITKLNCDEIVCLGDISGFSVPHYSYFDTRNAIACLNLIREHCNTIIVGNHDLHAARKTPKINPEFEYPTNWYQMDYHQRKELSNNNVWLYEHDELSPLYTKADIAFIESLPEIEIININHENIMFSHYCFPNLTGSSRDFYNYIEEFNAHKAFMLEKECSLSFVGHRHFNGLLIASNENLRGLRLGKKHKLAKGDCIHVPPLTGNQPGNGFCIFDTETNTVESFRI